MRKYIYIILVVSNFINFQLYSQDFAFKHLTVDDGLSQSSVNCIKQTKDGYLWFGTQEGLNRYNGYEFKIYANNPKDTNSLSNSWIWSIAEDKKGNLWIGTNAGLNYFDRKTNKFKRFIHNSKIHGSIPSDQIYGVYVDKDDVLWIKTITSICKYNKSNNEFIEFEHCRDFLDPEQSDFPFPIIETKDGLWVGSYKGLQNFNKNQEKFKLFTHKENDPTSLSDNTVYSVVEDKQQMIWIATNNGLNRLDPKTKKIKHFNYEKNNNSSISSNQIILLFVDGEGYLWVGTRGNGVDKINTTTLHITHFKNEKGNKESLALNTVYSIFEDNSKNIWLGTNGNGIDNVSLRQPKFKLYKNSSGANSYNLSENMIAAVYEYSEDIIWIGTWSNGLNILNRKTRQVIRPNIKIHGNDIHVIFERKNGDIFLGTSNGISIYNKTTQEFSDYIKKIGIKTTKLDNNRIYSIIEDENENLWIGTSNGLHKIDTKTNELTTFSSNKKIKSSISNSSIITVFEDSEGFIWVGTSNGLNKFNPSSNTFEHFISDNSPSNHIKNDLYKTINSNYIFAILEDKQGYLWIGTTSGINKYDKITGTFRYFTKKDGLPNETVYELIQDKLDNIWYSTNRGIGYLNPKTELFTNFDKGDGLQGLEYNNGASFKSNKSGEIYFGGSDGLNSFIPGNLVKNDIIPKVVIESYEKISSKGVSDILLDGVEAIHLNSEDKSIKIKFASLEFTNPSKNQYKYKLEGFDEDWINNGTNHYAVYSNLSQGEYIFKVKGSNNDLIWSTEATLIIRVSPPWYISYWAFSIYFVLTISVISVIIRLRTKKLNAVNQTLRQKQIAAMEIAKQKEELDTLITNIRDSITYAERIQKAMMPSEFLFKKLLPESFLLYRPKDIVSGDFYWIAEKNNKVFVAAVDCTGHGVPGAFMSIIGFDLLRNITRDQGIEDPSEILNRMNIGVSETFSKNAGEAEVKDGMDISIIVIDKNLNQLEYSGALNPLYIVRDAKIIEIKGSRFSIGSQDATNTFDNHKINLKKDDMLYIFSDGYADQFGGPLGKKYKFRRFRHTLLTIHNMPVKKQKLFLNENLDSWMGDLEQVDDVLLIGIRV